MKKMKGLLLAATLMLTANALMAQSYSESALIFSRTRPTGSARILGMGGAQISLGGDMSSAASNPAGLGMFNRSEFTISPGYFQLNNNGTYFSGDNQVTNGNNDSRTGIYIPSFGLIFSRPQNGDGGFIQGTFGITSNRINDFNSNYRYSGTNPDTRLVDYFLDNATGGFPDQFSSSSGALYNTVTGLAYDNFLIGEASILDDNNPDDQYFTDAEGPAIQKESVQTKGAQNQWNFSYGANFNDKFFLGAGLGIVSLNYSSRKVFDEDYDTGPLIGYTLTEDLQIRGTGINLTVGGIVRPVEGLQIGASIATPTRYNLTEEYNATIKSSWDNWDYYGDGSEILGDKDASTDVVTSGYNLVTPWKLSAGASYIFGKRGLISLDVEQLNYGKAKYQSQDPGIDYGGDNSEISSTYRSRVNVRLGGELRVVNFRFRGGLGIMPDPNRNQSDPSISNTFTTASLGVGYRKKSFFIDVAYVSTVANGNFKFNNGLQYDNSPSNFGVAYRPYTVQGAPNPSLRYDQAMTNVITTFGFTF